MIETENRPYADANTAAKRLLEIAKEVEALDGRIHTVLINGPFLYRDRGSPAEYSAGLQLLIQRKLLLLDESGNFVRLPGGKSSLPAASRYPDSKTTSDKELDKQIEQLRPLFDKIAESPDG